MEFNFNIEEIIGNSNNGICYLEGFDESKFNPIQLQYLKILIDTIGNLSAKENNLQNNITNSMYFFGYDHHIYLKCSKNIFYGFLKVGHKRLFIYDKFGKITEICPLSLLDFYVLPNYQRKGIGFELFSSMLLNENIEPSKIGYDNPNEKMLNFLKKYFNLWDYIKQKNNFVIFNEYYKVNKENNYNLPYEYGKFNSFMNDIYFKGNGISESNNIFIDKNVNNLYEKKAFTVKTPKIEYNNINNIGNYNENNNIINDNNQNNYNTNFFPHNFDGLTFKNYGNFPY
jgi:alpha-tubulin N-acetyltransferase 1